jgi:glycine/D-amino acid oxidase-like deaminating enzyme
MREVKLFPTTTARAGGNVAYKHHTFLPGSEIRDAYDYVVVGAGYGGQAAARHLAELHPEARIAVFEAIRIGANDSGKNAGFIIDVPHDFGDQGNSSFAENQKYFELNTFIIKWMEDTIKAKGIEDVDWDHCGKYPLLRRNQKLQADRHEIDELKRMNCSYEVVEGDELHRRIGTRYYKKALYTSGTVLINPADVLRGLFSVMPEKVEVFEECPVMRVDEGNPPSVLLRNGRKVRAKAVIVTAGPFIPQFGIGSKVFCPRAVLRRVHPQFTEDENSTAGVNPGAAPPATPRHPERFTRDRRIFVRNGFLSPPPDHLAPAASTAIPSCAGRMKTVSPEPGTQLRVRLRRHDQHDMNYPPPDVAAPSLHLRSAYRRGRLCRQDHRSLLHRGGVSGIPKR